MYLLKDNTVKKLLPLRPVNANKSDFGRVLIISGSKGMTGACYMSALAALKSGCGLVYCALPETERQILATMLAEAITIALPCKKGYVIPSALKAIKDVASRIKFDVLIIGPGLGANAGVFSFIIQVIQYLSLPSVIDADALNAIAYKKDLNFLKNIPHILTPHEGEIKRIIGGKDDRIKMAEKLSYFSGGITVLKGNRTIITNGRRFYFNTTGNVGLAKAGSGDVLSGLIGGIWAQLGRQEGFNLKTALESALCGVWLHGKSADIAVKHLTNRCLLATELLDYLPAAFKSIK